MRTPAKTLWTSALLATFVAAAAAQEAETITEDGIVSGTMEIDFKTRTQLDTSGKYKEGSAALNVQDVYKLNLVIAKTTEFVGDIVRQPNVFTKGILKRVQGASIGFKLDLNVRNPKDLAQKMSVGKWVGIIPIDEKSGAYTLRGGESPLRIDVQAINKQPAFKEEFGGRLVGKAGEGGNLAEYTYKRFVGNREVVKKVTRVDPMRFENIELAKGPRDNDPRTVVNGRLDYDYETGNWFTDGIRFKYSLNGKDYEDVVTGSIKWVEDPSRSTNGKGRYEFNLRFNEARDKKAGGDAAIFEKMSDEDAFFAVDNSIPALTGMIDYVDTMSGETVTHSKVTYNLKANKLTKQQVVNFFKLWLICVGPTNDE